MQFSRKALSKTKKTNPKPTLSHSDDVFETKCAIAGEALPFASPTEVLAVGPLGIHVAHLDGAGAPRLLAALGEKAEVGGRGPGPAQGRAGRGSLTWQVMSSTRYGL